MPNFNTIVIVGHLTRDPEVRYTPNGKAVAKFGIACNHKWGEHEEVCFVDVDCWGKTAENVGLYLHKGDAALVNGRLAYETWEDKSGNKRSKHKIVSQNVVFLPKGGAAKDYGDSGEDDIPF
jgi:single-strand DNA-binding protein